MSNFADNFEAVEVSRHFGQMIDDRSNTEQCRGASEFLKQKQFFYSTFAFQFIIILIFLCSNVNNIIAKI